MLYDISLTVNKELPVYPGDPSFEFDKFNSIKNGNKVNNWSVTMCFHLGTHIDAPNHFIDSGKTVEQLPPDRFFGVARVIALQGVPFITAEMLEDKKIEKDEIILFKTDNSSFIKDSVFHRDFVYISHDAAVFLKNRGVKTVGLDYLTIDPLGSIDFPAHTVLLGNDIPLIEGINLYSIEEGEYLLSALPAKIEGANGFPVRAVLMKEDGFTMNNMRDIIDSLDGDDRTKAWDSFRGLTLAAVWKIRNELDSEKIRELRRHAGSFNDAAKTKYFDLTLGDCEFIDSVVGEIEKVRKLPKKPD